MRTPAVGVALPPPPPPALSPGPEPSIAHDLLCVCVTCLTFTFPLQILRNVTLCAETNRPILAFDKIEGFLNTTQIDPHYSTDFTVRDL